MSRAPGPGLCAQPMWWGYGADAGCCKAEAFGPTPKNHPGLPLRWACPRHGGPPKTHETIILRTALLAQVVKVS